MEYTAHYDADRGICTVHVTGRHKRPDDSEELQRFARDFGSEHGCRRFLFDMTQAEILGNTMDMFRTGMVRADTDHRQRTQRIALLYAADAADQRFLETVALNRGYSVRVFNHIDKAMAWLTANQKDA